jgi:hypothetical protein
VANVFIKAGQIVDAASLLLQREIVLPRLVWSQPSAAFVGALNDTVTLRVPTVRTARTRTMRSTTALQADDLTETSVPVVLDTHVYDLLNITDEQLTLDIVDFARQVLSPQLRGVAEGMEDVIAGALDAATVAAGQEIDDIDTDTPPTSGQAYAVAIEARKILNDLNVPRSERVLVLGSDLEAWFLQDPVIVNHNSGNRDALDDAMISRIAGFTIVGSNAVDSTAGFAFHRTAIAFANVAPALPDGATMKARVSTESLALRYLRDYNPTNSTGPVDRSLVDAFVGADSVEQDGNNNRLVKLTVGS